MSLIIIAIFINYNRDGATKRYTSSANHRRDYARKS